MRVVSYSFFAAMGKRGKLIVFSLYCETRYTHTWYLNHKLDQFFYCSKWPSSITLWMYIQKSRGKEKKYQHSTYYGAPDRHLESGGHYSLFAIQLRKLWFCETTQIKLLLHNIPYLNVLIQLPYKKKKTTAITIIK